MPDIWENLAASATSEIDALLFQLRTGSVVEGCESPIEEAFMVATVALQLIHGGGYPLLRVPNADDIAEAQLLRRPRLFIAPQEQFDKYRADFVMGFAGYGDLRQTGVIVECDGHDFHERTKEQAQRDKERDRHLQTRVAKVIRFTGREVFQDPMACAESALNVLEHALMAWHTR